ncbi:MAG: UDP-N-acetylmuramoyl-tripeptide--D-alanyl-D-alanine ligase [Rhodospirillaceae bacterium]|nr:UDP-N-acetylmuramoyl-tripeptide--D-alanyl-D-alanine ligase [Rhodospirillaceae bacterium]|tara:strand:+ start:106 stop:1476 length:1371 start_codon:yes stop_codon:yes gene_type:complete
MPRTLSAAAQEAGGELVGLDAVYSSVSIDSRKLDSGDLFVAIAGETFDGNDFVADAHSKGAAGALVSRLTSVPLPQIHVTETRQAFGRIAKAWRKNFSIPVVAVTGSNGKTTVKELIANILSSSQRVCVTHGNLNNELGVPLTLLKLNKKHEVLVIELGANCAGEIDYLSKLVKPTVGVITNANAAHLEGFKSIAGVAEAKGELLDNIVCSGTAVVNADDEHCAEWCNRSNASQILTFGIKARADCTIIGEIKSEPSGSHFTLCLPDASQVDVLLPLLGMHNVLNALAASTVAYTLGVSKEEIKRGLSQASAVNGRLNILPSRSGAKIIDDTYNANPDSVRAALNCLKDLSGRRVFVLGDMAELGETSIDLHQEIGTYAKDCCDFFFTVGDLSLHAAKAFGHKSVSFSNITSLQQALEPLLTENTVLLLKGSRSMGLERVVELIIRGQKDRECSLC